MITRFSDEWKETHPEPEDGEAFVIQALEYELATAMRTASSLMHGNRDPKLQRHMMQEIRTLIDLREGYGDERRVRR